MVIENGRLAGLICLKDLVKFLALKIELEEEKAPSGTAQLHRMQNQ